MPKIYKTGLANFFDDEIEYEKLDKTLIFDGHNLAFRTLHIAHMEDPTDTSFLYWKFLFLQSVFLAIKRYEPDRCVICFDGKWYWRKKIFPEYKMQRKAQRDGSSIDFDQFYRVFNIFINELKTTFDNLFIINIPRCEADDVIAVICKHIQPEKDTIIITKDADMIQLMQNKKIKIFDPIKKDFVKCLDPKTALEIKIIQGDKSDNIPAIKKRVGEKTAQKIHSNGLEEFLIENEECRPQYELNKKLIDFDFIPHEIIDLIKKEFNQYPIKPFNLQKVETFLFNNKIRKLYEEMGVFLPYFKQLS